MIRLLRTAPLLVALAAWPLPTAAQPPAVSVAPANQTGETGTAGGTPITLSLLAGGDVPLLVVRLGAAGRTVANPTTDEVAQAIDQMLDRLQARNSLPERFTIQLGSLDPFVLPLLQMRLTRPGANWNARIGDARHGSAYATLPGEALAAIDGTKLAQVFRDRGYRLSAGPTAEHIEIGHVSGHGNARLPIVIGYLPILAVRQ